MLLWLCLAGCERKEPENDTGRTSFVWLTVGESCGEAEADTETEQRMREYGLVDIREMDSTVFVYLVYARANNFIGKVLYPDIRKAFMLPETAKCLTDAHRRLKVLRPELRLLVYDAARPMHVQEEMWKCVRGTDKRMYVSNPANGGGLHNYGAAVDVTLADADGMPLPMGSPFDYFGEEARPDREEELVKQGKLILPHLHNRRLLRRVMTDAGFKVLSGEWWHFNLFSREEAKKNLRKIEIRNKE
ncbi:MAG: M15 family metallopeptidase [Odoribacter sp.]|nr:M15 family metallopeptidase [Odoribacter sp.]